jgi:putative oxidoreductase
MRIVRIVLSVVVGIIFLAQGLMKLTGVQNEWRDDLQVAPWFWVLTGVIQLAGALGLFASVRYERIALPSGALFVVVMLGAIATHIRVGDPISHMLFPAGLLILSGAISVIAWQRSESGMTVDDRRRAVDPA